MYMVPDDAPCRTWLKISMSRLVERQKSRVPVMSSRMPKDQAVR